MRAKWSKQQRDWMILKDGPHLLGEVREAFGVWIGTVWESRYMMVSKSRIVVMRAIRKQVSRG